MTPQPGDTSGSLDTQIQGILRAVREHLNMEVGFISEFNGPSRVYRYTDAAGQSRISAGSSHAREETLCSRVVAGELPELITDARAHPIAGSMPITAELGIRTHVCVPIHLIDRQVYGTLGCYSTRVDRSVSKKDLKSLTLGASILSRLFDTQIADHDVQTAKRERISNIIGDRALAMHFQPIYRLGDGTLSGFEALARFQVNPPRTPDVWFAEAHDVGRGIELEIAAATEAITALKLLPASSTLSFNLSPRAILSPSFHEMLDGQPVDRLVVELTEHDSIEDYLPLCETLRVHRGRGLQLAIDDLGAGHSSFRHVLELKPDLIKLDMGLTRNIDRDPGRRALAAAITRYSHSMGCEVVAEGVETVAELRTLQSLNVTKIQGYLTGRPVPREAISLIDVAVSLPGMSPADTLTA